MKKWSFILCLFLLLGACNTETSLPENENPPVTTDPELPDGPDDPQPNIRVDIPLTPTELQLAASGNSFAYDLFGKIRIQEENTNFVMSPLSASLAFSMLNNGAAGTSREEIQKVLGFDGYKAEDINSYYKKMIEAAATIDPQVVLESANSIWINKGFPVLPDFVSINQEAFGAEICNEDFSKSSTLDLINAWASEKTHGKIPTILDNLEPTTEMILMNALYFLGDWQYPFEEENTKKEPFTNANGSKKEVDMMNHYIETSYVENDQFAMINLPYGNGAFYMQLILPHEQTSLQTVTENLGNSIEPITSDLQSTYALVSLKMPRFKIDYEIKLNEILKELGMASPFDPELADFSAISDIPLFISFVKQKATIDVNEKGSEAAAVTVIGMDTTSAGPVDNRDFHVDRPFIFIIRELSSNAIFFMGEVNEL